MTTKCDITIGKQMTLNTGNYTSIRPSVSMTLKDVDVDNIGKISDNLTTLLNMYLEREILMLQGTKNNIDHHGGPKGFAEEIDTNEVDKIIKQLEADIET